MGGCLARCMGGVEGIDLDPPGPAARTYTAAHTSTKAPAGADVAAPPPPPPPLSATDEANEYAVHAPPGLPAPPDAHTVELGSSARDVQLLVETGERGQDAAEEAAATKVASGPHAAAAAGLSAAQREEEEAAWTPGPRPSVPPAPAAQAPSSRQAPAKRPRPASLPAGSLTAGHLRWGATDKVLHTNILAWGEHDRQRACGEGGQEIKSEDLKRRGSAGAAQDPDPLSAVHQAATAAGSAADTTETQEGGAGEDEPEFVRLLRQDAARVLDLSSQGLADDEALSIASALLSNTTLVSLDLSANDVAGG